MSDETQARFRGRDKIVAHPSGLQSRLDRAIEQFDKSDSLADVLREFIALIDAGCKEAYFFAGCIYEDGGKDVERNIENAVFYYKRSVEELGYVEGYLALGRLYYYGIGVGRDYDKAFEYYSLVAEHSENPIAQMMLGRMYLHGHGVQRDLAKARTYLSGAASSGNVHAIKSLAILEEDSGNRVTGIVLRLKAGVAAFLIGCRNMKDYRLRAG